MLLTLVNALIGAICGFLFRVQILVPLIAFACVEALVLKQAVFWHAMLLVVAVEIGYLAGGAAVALWLSIFGGGRRISSELPATNPDIFVILFVLPGC
jgi:hypothetical protein